MSCIIKSMFYLIRHGQSHFNFQADIKLRQQMGTNFAKKSQQYQSLKFDPRFIDCQLTQQGYKQCVQARQKMKDVEVEVVIVSPIRRALITCHQIFKSHPSKPKIIVDPQIRGVYSSSCDIGGNLSQSMKQFPQFDYSLIKNPSYWYLQNILNEKIREQLLSQIKNNKEQEQSQEYLKLQASRLFLQYLIDKVEEIKPNTFTDFQYQKQKLRKLGQKYKTVVLVSHSENILAYTGYQPNNCEVVEIQYDKF